MNHTPALSWLLGSYFLFCILLPVSAQKAQISKECFSASRHEVAENLCLYSNHRFEYASSYGAVDLYGKGSWKKNGEQLILQADSSGAPYEVVASNDPGIKKDYVQLVFKFNGRAAAYIKLDALANLGKDAKEIGQLKKINNQFVWLLHKDSLNPVISLTNSLMEGAPFFYLLPPNKNHLVFSPGTKPDLLGFKTLHLQLDEQRHVLIDGTRSFMSEGSVASGNTSFVFDGAYKPIPENSEATAGQEAEKTVQGVYHDLAAARQAAKKGNGFIFWLHPKPGQSGYDFFEGNLQGQTIKNVESYLSDYSLETLPALTFLIDSSNSGKDNDVTPFFKLTDSSGNLYMQTLGFLPEPGKLYEELQYFLREKSVAASFASVNQFLGGDTSLQTINKIIALKKEDASYNSREALDSISYVNLLNRLADAGTGRFDPWRYELVLDKYEEWERLYYINESNAFNSAFWKYLRKYYFEFENYKKQSIGAYALSPVYTAFRLLNKATSQFGYKEYDQGLLNVSIDSNWAWIPKFKGIRFQDLWKRQLNNLLDLVGLFGGSEPNNAPQSDKYKAANKASLLYLNQVLDLGNGSDGFKKERDLLVAEFKTLTTKVNWTADPEMREVGPDNCEAYFTNDLQNSAIVAIVLYTNQGRDSSKAKESIGWLNNLRSVKDENSSLSISLAFLQYQIGNKQEAIKYLQERLAYFIKQPDNKYYLRVMGSVLRKMQLNLPIN